MSSRPNRSIAVATMASPLAGVGRVGVVGHRLAARRRDLCGNVVGRAAAVRVDHPVAVVDHDLRALPGQRQAERPAETPPAAGDDRHPPGQRPARRGLGPSS